MVRRRRTGSVAPAPRGQRRLDEMLGESPEAREERAYSDLRGSRSEGSSPPYEERVAAWVREREEAMRKRGIDPAGLPSPAAAPPAGPTADPSSGSRVPAAGRPTSASENKG